MIVLEWSDLGWIAPLIVWEIGWKGLAMWKAGRRNQPGWFVALLLINSIGLLPIIYLALSRKSASE